MVTFTLDLGNPAAVANFLALTESEIATLLDQQKRFGNMSPAKASGLAKKAREQFADGPWQKQKDAVTEALGFYPFRGGKAPADELLARIAIDVQREEQGLPALDYGQPWQRYEALQAYGYSFANPEAAPIEMPDDTHV